MRCVAVCWCVVGGDVIGGSVRAHAHMSVPLPPQTPHHATTPTTTARRRLRRPCPRLVPADGRSAHTLIAIGAEAFLTLNGLAAAAQRSLDVQYYLWEEDGSGRRLLSALLGAADRGVRVRLLVDFALPVFKLAPRYIRSLEQAGVEVRHVIVIVCETAPPHGIAVFRLLDDVVAWYRPRVEAAAELYAECAESGVWPGHPREVREIGLPRWHDAMRQVG